MKKIKISEPVSGGLLLSYKCTCGCRHCLYNCSSDWSPAWLEEEKAEKILALLAEYFRKHQGIPGTIGLNSGLWHRVGISMPFSRASSRIVIPSRPMHCELLMVTTISLMIATY